MKWGVIIGLSALLATVGGASASWVEDEIMAQCAAKGCDGGYVIQIMYCESGGNPNAVGPHGELGLFQIDPRYWGVMSDWEQIDFTTTMIARGRTDLWVCA